MYSSVASWRLVLITSIMNMNYKYVPLPRAKNANLWKYFGFKSEDGRTPLPKYMNKVFCTIKDCKHLEIAYNGNTINILHHLSQHHPQQNAEYLGLSSPTPQSSITSFIGKKMALTDTKAKQISQRIVDVIVEDLRPMSIVEGTGFTKLMATVASNYPLATADYYTQEVNNRYATAVSAVKVKLAKIEWVAITSDLWTSISQHSYLSITAHYVHDDAGTLETTLLAVMGKS